MDLNWYSTLSKPFFTPPAWLFGFAWTVLYLLMAISVILIWQNGYKRHEVKNALKVFVVQLALNLIWSPMFFVAHQIFVSLLIIIILWYFIFKTIKVFYKIDKFASYLLWPYLIWVSFATILDFSVWWLNR